MPTARPADDAAIREQAYYFWEADGRPHGRESEYWQRAVAAVTETTEAKPKAKAAAKPEAEAKPAAKLKAAATKSKAVPAKAEPAKKPKKK